MVALHPVFPGVGCSSAYRIPSILVCIPCRLTCLRSTKETRMVRLGPRPKSHVDPLGRVGRVRNQAPDPQLFEACWAASRTALIKTGGRPFRFLKRRPSETPNAHKSGSGVDFPYAASGGSRGRPLLGRASRPPRQIGSSPPWCARRSAPGAAGGRTPEPKAKRNTPQAGGLQASGVFWVRETKLAQLTSLERIKEKAGFEGLAPYAGESLKLPNWTPQVWKVREIQNPFQNKPFRSGALPTTPPSPPGPPFHAAARRPFRSWPMSTRAAVP